MRPVHCLAHALMYFREEFPKFPVPSHPPKTTLISSFPLRSVRGKESNLSLSPDTNVVFRHFGRELLLFLFLFTTRHCDQTGTASHRK